MIVLTNYHPHTITSFFESGDLLLYISLHLSSCVVLFYDCFKSIIIKKLIDYFHCWQLNKCVCLEQIPGQGSKEANDCSSSCSRKYPYETSITFTKDCGGNQTYNLFKSGTVLYDKLLILSNKNWITLF